MAGVHGLHEPQLHLLLQLLGAAMGHRDEDLVRLRHKRDVVPLVEQHLTDLVRLRVRVLRQLEIQVVGEQRVELQAEQPALGKQRAVQFDERGEILGRVAAREHDRLAEHGADLRAADREDVGDARKVVEIRVVRVTCERIAQARAVDEQRHAVVVRHLRERGELGARIHRAVFGRLRDIHAARAHHVRMVRVRVEALAIVVELRRADLAVLLRQCEHLVPGRLDRAGFVRVDVRTVRADDSRILRGDRVDDHLVRLRAAGEEPDVAFRVVAQCADLAGSGLAVVVRAVAGVRLVLDLLHARDDLRAGGGGIIVFKRQHGGLLSARRRAACTAE